MCWKTYNKRTLKRRVAKKDIPCYKVFHEEYGLITSPFYAEAEWEFGKVYETALGLPYPNNFFFPKERLIDYGFHTSLSPIEKAEKPYGISWRNEKGSLFSSLGDVPEYVYECVIPAGAEYYLNEFDEYVSDKLKIVKKKTA